MTTTIDAPETMYRSVEGLGVWEHRGKVAAVGVGHSPTSRRWGRQARNHRRRRQRYVHAPGHGRRRRLPRPG